MSGQFGEGYVFIFFMWHIHRVVLLDGVLVYFLPFIFELILKMLGFESQLYFLLVKLPRFSELQFHIQKMGMLILIYLIGFLGLSKMHKKYPMHILLVTM